MILIVISLRFTPKEQKGTVMKSKARNITILFFLCPLAIIIWILVTMNSPTLPQGCPPVCIGADLRNKDLAGKDLSEADLSGANLSGANLSGVNLSNADLNGALLVGANLEKANLSGAILKGANLRQANLRGTVLLEADLSGADLTGAILAGVDLTTVVDLTAVIFHDARLIGTDFSGAIMRGANLSGADLRGAKLSGADLTGAHLDESNLAGANMTGAILHGALLDGAILIGTNLRKAKLNGASLNGPLNTSLHGVDLSEADLSGADLFAAELSGVELFRATLTDANLVAARLNGVDLRGADLNGAKLLASDLSKTELRALIAKLLASDLSEVELHTPTAKPLASDLSEVELRTLIAELLTSDLSEAELRTLDDPNVIPNVIIRGYEIDDKTPAEANGEITLYTSIPQDIIDRIQTDFEKKFPNITLNVFRAQSNEIVLKVMAEKEAGDIRVDLIWLADPSIYEEFKDQDMLLQYSPPESVFLLPGMMDSGGYYYAGRLINMVVVYNTAISTRPKGWQDLLKPEYQGKQGFLIPQGFGAADISINMLLDSYGWEYFEQLESSGCVQVQSNGLMIERVSTGELMIGSVLDYLVRQAKAEGKPIDYVWPEEAFSIPSPLSILNTTQNLFAAQVFVDYVLSRDGQETMVKLGSFFPVRFDVQPPEGVSFPSQIKMPSDWETLQERESKQDQWIAIFGEYESE